VKYSVKCECGRAQEVSTGDAGATVTCSCGRKVEVPSLSVLRREAGQFTAAPELILESMLANSELPDSSDCVVCHTSTDGIRTFDVHCERTETRKEVGGCGYFAYWILFGWVGLLWASLLNRQHTAVLGRNVRFMLPLRICPTCDGQIASRDFAMLLCRVPVYDHLIAKYPHATVKRC
jgi:hypothetical protein